MPCLLRYSTLIATSKSRRSATCFRRSSGETALLLSSSSRPTSDASTLSGGSVGYATWLWPWLRFCCWRGGEGVGVTECIGEGVDESENGDGLRCSVVVDVSVGETVASREDTDAADESAGEGERKRAESGGSLSSASPEVRRGYSGLLALLDAWEDEDATDDAAEDGVRRAGSPRCTAPKPSFGSIGSGRFPSELDCAADGPALWSRLVVRMFFER